MKIFGKAFLISAAILMSVALIAALYLTSGQRYTGAHDNIVKGYIPTKEESLNILAVFIKSGDKSPEAICMIRFDAEKARIPVLVLPNNMNMSVGKKIESLENTYKNGGIKKLKRGIKETLGVNIDRYIVCKTGYLSEITDRLGEVEVEFKADRTIDGKRYISGAHIGGQEVAAALEGDDHEVAAEIICSYINSFFEEILCEGDQSEIKDMIYNTVNDFSYNDFEKYYEAAQFLNSIKNKPALALRPAVTEVGENCALIEESAEYIRKFFE